MKRLFKYLYITTLAVAFSCNESEDLVTANAREGGLLDPASTSVNYVVGQPAGPYNMSFFVRQGDNQTTQVRLYKSFTTTVTYTEIVEGEEVEKEKTFVSNEILAETIDITESGNHHISTSYDFEELKSGLEIESLNAGPAPLPAADGDYQIGDKWVFRVESVLSDGRVVEQASPINVAVSTRYAGTYKPVAAEYYRLGVLTTDLSGWPDEVTIESVDATTYRVLEYWGPFEANEFLFQVNDGVITYPDDQILNDQPMITCESNPADFIPAVNCGNTNFVVNDDVAGKDRLHMTNGYYTAGSGPRVMYQVLEKVVN
jgi:hypothetical protein